MSSPCFGGDPALALSPADDRLRSFAVFHRLGRFDRGQDFLDLGL